MILKASQRGGAMHLAKHLLNDRDNEHVTVHSVNGFVASDVAGALMEMYAVSRPTRCRQFMFSLSLSPPRDAVVTPQDFQDAVDLAAEKLGLQNQSRVVLLHEKSARLHCHAVFCRIHVESMKAINLPFYKERLNELARELYLSHGWELPKGLSDRSLSNPTNFGLTEWQEAQRAKRDPREIKSALKQCWGQSDSAASFAAALRERGFWLARGDRRGFVAVDYRNNVYSLSRWLDVKPKELKARLGEPEKLASVDQANAEIAALIGATGKRLLDEMAKKHAEILKALFDQKRRMVARQREERKQLAVKQTHERAQQTREYSKRFRRGLKGLFDWITGRRAQILRSIKGEQEEIRRRSEAAFDALRFSHLDQLRLLHAKIEKQRKIAAHERQGIIESLPATQAHADGLTIAEEFDQNARGVIFVDRGHNY
ncbi:relaxase/mobilization nuclease domain-containing protein [Rhizobium sp. RU36D]|uniref:relaxase/mobilization nuclease domain-containing protein n=1 Tax=Rhizobium sp. RU36D TaxID=1907415 RepID=UPI0009D89B10|nr:relaxase/mobilization nuclease domain-containing protein [Rhizobium sp. RU36D]SMD17457.1 Relaxase/Mobilisation nuclease domain-containing protein [Rhizobium sp. RU36D]